MFIGYNMARRSGPPEKDFLRGAFLLNPLRIRVLRSSGRSNLRVNVEQRRTTMTALQANQPNARHVIINCAAGLPPYANRSDTVGDQFRADQGTFPLV